MNLNHTPQPDRAIDLLPERSLSAAPARRFSIGRLITFGFAWMFGLEPFLTEPGALTPLASDATRRASPGLGVLPGFDRPTDGTAG